jgi:hypothetical protein
MLRALQLNEVSTIFGIIFLNFFPTRNMVYLAAGQREEEGGDFKSFFIIPTILIHRKIRVPLKENDLGPPDKKTNQHFELIP